MCSPEPLRRRRRKGKIPRVHRHALMSPRTRCTRPRPSAVAGGPPAVRSAAAVKGALMKPLKACVLQPKNVRTSLLTTLRSSKGAQTNMSTHKTQTSLESMGDGGGNQQN